MPMFTVVHETKLEIEADDFQGARDKAVCVLYGGDEDLGPEGTMSQEIVVITDENGREEGETETDGNY